MTASRMHWAAALIGKPWRSGACGPDAFDCWNLVRFVYRTRLGIDLPEVRAGDDDHAALIFAAVEVTGCRPSLTPLEEMDIVMMRNKRGSRHCGVAVRANGRIGLLHADGHESESGPVGSVVWQSLADATSGGYHDHECWRRS